LKFCDSFSVYDVRAVLMSAAWTPTTGQTALKLAVALRTTGPTLGSRRSECLRCHDTQMSQK